MNPDSLSHVRHIALDLDGTIYRGGTLFEFTVPFLRELGELGIGHTFLTNNSSKSTSDYVEHLNRLGIPATRDQVYTSTRSTIEFLRQNYPQIRNVFVLGTPSLMKEFQEAGYQIMADEEAPQCVIVGYDTALPYPRLCKAAWWISKEIPYIATHPDRVCPTDQPLVLIDCGAVCACLESATGIPPFAVLGKPDPRMLTGIMRAHNLKPNELIMAGDRIYTDMAMAQHAGAVSVLVLTGEATREDAEVADQQPDLILPSLSELGVMLKKTHKAVC